MSVTAGIGVTSTACDFQIFDDGFPTIVDFGQDCETDSDCAHYVPSFDFFGGSDPRCNRGICQEKRCTTLPRSGDAPDPRPGDCQRLTCFQGALTSREDENDLPPDSSECTVGQCSSGFPYQANVDDGTPCSVGVCRAGQCVEKPDGNLPDAGGDAGDASDADGG